MINFFNREEKYFISKLIDNANSIVLYFDVKGRILYCNKKLESFTGKEKQLLKGINWLDVLFYGAESSTKQQMFKVILDDTIAYKRPNNFDGIILDCEGNERQINWSVSPILSDTNNMEGILLVGNDVTELKEREASLKKIDDTLKNIFSSIKEYALYVVNLDGNITYFGMGAELMFGWQKNEIIFKHVSLLHSESDATSKLPFVLEQVRRSVEYETEIDLMRKDGTPFPVNLTVSQFLDSVGNLAGYIFIAKDITERKRLEYQIFQAEKMAAVGELSAGIAHDINNPLFVISGRVELLLENKKLGEKTLEDLEIISAQATRIRKLTEQLLKFSRNIPAQVQPVNINEIIEGVVPLLSYHKLPDSKIVIEKRLTRQLLLVEGDLNQLQEVFLNLLLNAYQAMPEGGKICIETENMQNRYVIIRISDTGCGIHQHNLKNIFMPFFSTKKDGTGLGLSICYNIIKNHNGSIDVESQLGQGTTFLIRLPFA